MNIARGRYNSDKKNDTVLELKMPYDIAENLSACENGKLNDAATVELFQKLVDSGHVWDLDAEYGKKAVELSDAGLIKLRDIGLDPTYFFGP